MLILLVSLLGFAGLVFDAGMAFNARRDAANIAAAAARSGADMIDEAALYTDGQARLLPGAVFEAKSFALAQGADKAEAETLDHETIKVTVERVHDTTFLGLVGISSLTVEASSTTVVRSTGTGR